MLRYDGIYQAKEEDYFLYLRFYADGTVLTVSSGSHPDQVFSLISKDQAEVSTGNYTLEGDTLSFSATSEEGTVDYHGQLDGERLVVQSYSHINESHSDEEYTFVPVFPVLYEGEPVYLRVRCNDALRFADGGFGEVEEWLFYLKAPSGWAYAPALRERVARLAVRIYDGLNWHSGLHPTFDDGSRYVLGHVEAAILSESEAALRPWRGRPYYALLQGDAILLLSEI